VIEKLRWRLEKADITFFLECLRFTIRFPPPREGRRLISGVVLWYTFLQIWSNDKRNFSCRSVRIRTRTRPRIGFVHSRLSRISFIVTYLVHMYFDRLSSLNWMKSYITSYIYIYHAWFNWINCCQIYYRYYIFKNLSLNMIYTCMILKCT